MAWFRSQVTVTLIDDTTGESFATTEMSPSDLPESFETDTTLHLGEEKWQVVNARPTTRAEYARTKTLTLRLRRLEMIDPSKLSFSLATICDRLPPLQSLSDDRRETDFLLHEDDWGQIEFVASKDIEHVTSLTAQIRQFRIDNWNGHGWNEIFVRHDHPTAFASLGIRFDALRRVFADLPPCRVFVFQSFSDPVRSAREVLGGFCFHICDGLVIYGRQVDGTIAALAVEVCVDNESNGEAVLKAISSVGRLGTMTFVDWNRDRVIDLDDPHNLDRWLSDVIAPG